MNVLILLLLIVFASCQKETAIVGTSSRPFIMALLPSENATNTLDVTSDIEKFLSTHISKSFYNNGQKFHIKVIVPTSYVAALESFGSGRVDFAPISTLNYILAKDIKKLPVEAILIGVGDRQARDHYFSQIIVRADSNIQTISDLQNKKFAFTDPASTSGHLVPQSFLRKNNIKLKEKVYAGRHDNVVVMVYQQKVDAGATYHIPKDKNGKPRDARTKVLTQYPDVLEKVKILTLSDPIPNPPWILRQNIYANPKMNQNLKISISNAMIAFLKTIKGKKIGTELMNIQSLKTIKDSEYRQRLSVFDDEDLAFLK